MSPTRPAEYDELTGFPRVSGDEPAIGINKGVASVFSPRERG